MANNELDTHADTSCAGANWSLMELTGEICDINPFLASYQPVQEILVARCCTFGRTRPTAWSTCLSGTRCYGSAHSQLPNSLLNPNQMRFYGIRVYGYPFDTSRTFGIDSDQAFIPFDTMGTTVVHSESVCQPNGRRRTYRLYSLRARIGIHLRKCCVTGT
jgi:hypothetical protein